MLGGKREFSFSCNLSDRLLTVSTAAIILYEYSSRRPLLHVSDKASIAKGGQHPSCPRRKVDDELQLGLLLAACLLLLIVLLLNK